MTSIKNLFNKRGSFVCEIIAIRKGKIVWKVVWKVVWIEYETELEFSKILVPRLYQNSSNVNLNVLE